MSVFARHALWFGSILVGLACSSKGGIDFFDPPGDDDLAATGGIGATTGGTPSGGSGGDGISGMGGTSGDATGGTGADPSGGTAGDTGGSGAQGGTDAGMGGMPMTGGVSGVGGGGMSGSSGTSGSGMGGTGGAGMGGGGTGGAGTGGGGAGSGGMGGTAGVAGTGGCVPSVPPTERCDGVDNNCMGGTDEGSACPDYCTGATRGGHTYLFCSFEDAPNGNTRLRSWTQAQDFCTTRTHGLLFIETAEENAFILEWITRMQLQDQVWMGANDRDSGLTLNEGEWVWGVSTTAVQFWNGDENGTAVMNRYNDWADGEPNNQGNEDCAVLSAEHDYQWDDRICTNSYANFVCESLSITTLSAR